MILTRRFLMAATVAAAVLPGWLLAQDKPNDAIVPASLSSVGKKSWLNTRAAAVPYRKKSYHSMVVPIRLAKTTRLTLLAGTTTSRTSTDMVTALV